MKIDGDTRVVVAGFETNILALRKAGPDNSVLRGLVEQDMETPPVRKPAKVA